MTRLKTHSMQKGAENFLLLGRTIGTKIISICFRVGCKIGVNYRHFKIEASGYQYCIRKVTGYSEMTFEFVILPAFFEIEREKQE